MLGRAERRIQLGRRLAQSNTDRNITHYSLTAAAVTRIVPHPLCLRRSDDRCNYVILSNPSICYSDWLPITHNSDSSHLATNHVYFSGAVTKKWLRSKENRESRIRQTRSIEFQINLLPTNVNLKFNMISLNFVCRTSETQQLLIHYTISNGCIIWFQWISVKKISVLSEEKLISFCQMLMKESEKIPTHVRRKCVLGRIYQVNHEHNWSSTKTRTRRNYRT